jgi:hypothetical protein
VGQVAVPMLYGKMKWPSPSHLGDQIAQSEYRAHSRARGGRRIDKGGVGVAARLLLGKTKWPSPSHHGDEIG